MFCMLISIIIWNHNTIDSCDCHNDKLNFFLAIFKKRNYLLFLEPIPKIDRNIAPCFYHIIC
jgi:hypothetical protein